MSEQRPINPSRDYLQSQNRQLQQQKQTRNYLRKKHIKVLPCNQGRIHNPTHRKQNPRPFSATEKSKAQIYDQMKAKNKTKFGQWGKKQLEKNKSPQIVQKIQPSKMTVDYKPKKVHIETEEYRKSNCVKIVKGAVIDNQIQSKINYEKVVGKMREQINKLEQQKTLFQQQVESLKFKNRVLQNKENPIRKAKKDQNTLHSKIIKQAQKQAQVQQDKLDIKNRNTTKASMVKLKEVKKPATHEPSRIIEEAESEIVNRFILPIQKLSDVQGFSLKQIRQCVSLQNLDYDGNLKYKEATECLQKGEKQSVNNLNQKRVTKFNNGWIQVWIPGKQRIMTDTKGYKIIWFSNGDVKQIFRENGEVKSYFCKARRVVQITIGLHQKFYYFPQLGQLECICLGGSSKEVVFRDGIHEIIDT